MLADKGRSILIVARANLDKAKKAAVWRRNEIMAIADRAIDETPEIDQSSSPTADETTP
jgi:hypothetical protein